LELIYGKGTIENFIDENEEMLLFIIAQDESENTIACGALKHFNSVAVEIKRMYTKQEFRGKGISKKILMELEDHAKLLGYKRIILETGIKQPEAMNLYSKSGYNPLKCYGKHANDPDSRCFEKVF
jgi:GNAT superfamily N-acetyltransferase